MAKLLHLSDIHLNYGYGQLEENLQKHVKNNLFQSFQSSINFAVENNVDAVLIAGDLLDSPYIENILHSKMIKAIKQLIDNDIHFIYCTGNHDLSNYKLFTDEILESHLVTIFDKGTVEKRDIKTKNDEILRFVGCGHEDDFEGQLPVSLSMKKNECDPITIGVFHSSVVGSKKALEKDPYMPVEKVVLERLNYDYIALGHIHKHEVISDRIIYSGNIMGLTKKEKGQRGGYLVYLADQFIETKFVPFNAIQWESVEIDVTEMPENMDGFEKMLKEIVANVAKELFNEEQFERILLNINLKGTTSNYDEIISQACQEYLKVSLEDYFGFLSVTFKDAGLEKYRFKNFEIADEGYLNEVKSFVASMENNKAFLESLNEKKGLDEITNMEEYLKENKEMFYQKVMNLLTK